MNDYWAYYLFLALFISYPFIVAERAREKGKKAKMWRMLGLGIFFLGLLFTHILYTDMSVYSVLAYI
jgi:hypothetical protein